MHATCACHMYIAYVGDEGSRSVSQSVSHPVRHSLSRPVRQSARNQMRAVHAPSVASPLTAYPTEPAPQRSPRSAATRSVARGLLELHRILRRRRRGGGAAAAARAFGRGGGVEASMRSAPGPSGRARFTAGRAARRGLQCAQPARRDGAAALRLLRHRATADHNGERGCDVHQGESGGSMAASPNRRKRDGAAARAQKQIRGGDGHVVAALTSLARNKFTRRHLLVATHPDKETLINTDRDALAAVRLVRALVTSA